MVSRGASQEKGGFASCLRREGGGCRPAAQKLAEEVDSVVTTLPAGATDRHQDCLDAGADPGAIAAPDLAENDAEANGQFGAPVGGVQAGELEESPKSVPVL
jgi:hypothetical protein